MFDKIKIRFILAKLIEYKIINKRPLLKKKKKKTLKSKIKCYN